MKWLRKKSSREGGKSVFGMLAALLVCVCISSLYPDPAFVPGDSQINERDILDRMTLEIGEKNPSKSKPDASQSVQRTTSITPVDASQTITLTVKSGEKTGGKVLFSQKHFVLLPDHTSQKAWIPLKEIRSVSFKDWKPVIVLPSKAIYFLPSRCDVVRLDGSGIGGVPEMQDWMQINLPNVSYRSYFVGAAMSADLPPTTLTNIEFSHEPSTAAK